MNHPEHQAVRGFLFWSLAPFLLTFMVAMPLLVQKRDAGALITLAAVELLSVFVLLGLFNPFHFSWAWRGVGAIVFCVYSAYFVVMLVASGGQITITPRRSEPSAFNAICGLIVFGLPGLLYAVFGRPTLRRDPRLDESLDVYDDDAKPGVLGPPCISEEEKEIIAEA